MKKKILYYLGCLLILGFLLLGVICNVIDKTLAFSICVGFGLAVLWFLCAPGNKIVAHTPYIPPQPDIDLKPREIHTAFIQLAAMLVIPIVILAIIIYNMY